MPNLMQKIPVVKRSERKRRDFRVVKLLDFAAQSAFRV
jgi:hypothetical protein